jgi:hypothetical protein
MKQLMAALIGGNVAVEENIEKVEFSAGGMAAMLTIAIAGGAAGFLI